MTRGFDYKKRRDWQARGAKREWPPLNVQDMDPSLLANVNLTQVLNGGTGQLTWAAFVSSSQTVTSGIDLVIPSSDFSVLSSTDLSNDYPAAAWTTSGGVGIRMPRDGIRIVLATASWDANTTGTRFLQIDQTYGNAATTITEQAADNRSVTLVDVQPAIGGNDCEIVVGQNSGGNRSVTVDVFVAYLDGSGIAGGSGGGTTLQETYVSAITSGAQTIATGTLTTIATTAFGVGNLLSTDHVIGDWLDGTTNSVRFPKAGIATIQITVDWDTNATGNRFTQYQSAGVSNVATNISNAATDFVADHLQVVTNQDLYSAGDYGLIQVKQDSGANRTCTCEFVVFYHPTV